MKNLKVSLDELLPVKTATRALSLYIDDVESGKHPHYVITRRGKPRAALIGMKRYEELLEAERQLQVF